RVRMADVPLPRQQPQRRASQGQPPVAQATAQVSNATPLVAPDRIAEETGRESGVARNAGDVEVADLSAGVTDGVGQIAIEPTPPRIEKIPSTCTLESPRHARSPMPRPSIRISRVRHASKAS